MRNAFFSFSFVKSFFSYFAWNIPILSHVLTYMTYVQGITWMYKMFVPLCLIFCILIFHISKRSLIFDKKVKEKIKLKKKMNLPFHDKLTGKKKKKKKKAWDRIFFCLALWWQPQVKTTRSLAGNFIDFDILANGQWQPVIWPIMWIILLLYLI